MSAPDEKFIRFIERIQKRIRVGERDESHIYNSRASTTAVEER